MDTPAICHGGVFLFAVKKTILVIDVAVKNDKEEFECRYGLWRGIMNLK